MLSLSYAHDYQSKTTLDSEFATIFSKVGVGGSDLPSLVLSQMPIAKALEFTHFPFGKNTFFCNPYQFEPDKPNQLAVSSILCLHLSVSLSRFVRLAAKPPWQRVCRPHKIARFIYLFKIKLKNLFLIFNFLRKKVKNYTLILFLSHFGRFLNLS